MIKNLYRKIKYKIFKIKNPVVEKIVPEKPVLPEKIKLPKDIFNMDCFNNVEWIYYGGDYYPYHIIYNSGQKYYIPYVSTERINYGIEAGKTIMNKFLITKN